MWLRFGKHLLHFALLVIVGGLLSALMVRLAPGFDADEQSLDTRLSAESQQALRAQRQQDSNILRFYANYLANFVRGDLGTSRTLNRPVRELLSERLPVTATSLLYGLGGGWGLGFLLALAATYTRARWVDALSSLAAALLLCVPAALLAVLLVLARAPSRIAIALIVFPVIFRNARNLLAKSAALPHVLTARARGLGRMRTLWFHIVPTAAPELLALAGITVSIAIGASIPVEALCDVPGVGQLAWKAAMARDLPLLVNVTVLVTALTLFANTASDMITASLRSSAA